MLTAKALSLPVRVSMLTSSFAGYNHHRDGFVTVRETAFKLSVTDRHDNILCKVNMYSNDSILRITMSITNLFPSSS